MTIPAVGRARLAALVALAAAGPGCRQVGPAPAYAAPPVQAADAGPAPAPLQAEAREADPRSQNVKLKLWVTPVTAEVFWGAKRLGAAGREPLEIERPRGSGPLDVVVRAAGYLPFHTRLYTDRDDALTVRLTTPAAAPGLLGWKRAAPAKPRP
jgi:hypothetical protein